MTQLPRPSHLQPLEAENIHIMREVVAQRPLVKRGAGLIMVDDDRDQPQSMDNKKQEGYF